MYFNWIALSSDLLLLQLLTIQSRGASKICHGLVNHVEQVFVEHHLLTHPSSTPPPTHTHTLTYTHSLPYTHTLTHTNAHREEECRKRVSQLKKQLVEVKREKEEELNVSLYQHYFPGHCYTFICLWSGLEEYHVLICNWLTIFSA